MTGDADDEEHAYALGPEPAVSEAEALQASDGATPGDVKAIARHSNLGQEVIEITGDRCKIILTETAEKFAKRRDWLGPLGLFAGLGVSSVTADFKEVLGIPAPTVEGVILTLTALAGIWVVVAGVRALRSPSHKAVVTDALDALKHQRSA